ncbi:MAG: ATP-binding protein [Bacteroidetes bacterium]|nr:ATP-binding protein [Bacteroidota bacterium]
MNRIGIYTRILSVLILTSVIFIFLLLTLYFIKNKQEDLMLQDSRIQFSNEINSLITLKTAKLKQVVFDYTFWDDFVKNINKVDSAWYNENITTVLKSFHADYICVYDTSFNLIHQASSSGSVLHDIISKEILVKINELKFLNFFQLSDGMIVEISSATIHPNIDPNHTLTKPSGYLILVKRWDQDFLDELALLSGAKINLVEAPLSVAKDSAKTLSAYYMLRGWNDKNVARIIFVRTSNSLNLFHRMSILMILILLGSMLTTLLLFHFTSRRWINRPLKLVTSILKSGNLTQINELKQCGGEFEDIGTLFGEFIRQKDELRVAKERTEESERKFKNILDHSPFHIWEFDGEKYNFVNQAYIDFIGIKNFVEGKMDIEMWTKFVHPDDLAESGKIWMKAFEDKREHDNYFRLLNKSGEYRDCWSHAVPIFDENGKFITFQGYNLDITERRRAETEILKMNEKLDQRVRQRTAELEAVNKELETFSYSISHDLKAPLRHINGFIGLFLENRTTQLTEEELDYLSKITASATQMGKLIDAILSFSMLNQSELHKTTINTAQMVQQVIRFFDPEMGNRKITFHVAPLPDIRGDEELIRQVWTNLISNAIKYTGKKPEALIEIGSSPAESGNTFFVKDNGAGFDMKYIEKIFGVFQRLHKSRDFEGVGIGLANVKQIIKRHGGQCFAEALPEVGATFFFTIPD